MLDLYVQIIIIGAFTAGIVKAISEIKAISFLLFGCVYWIVRRLLFFALTSNKILFALNPWRLLDLVHCIMLIVSASYILKWDVNSMIDETGGRNILIATSCFIWLAMMSILRACSKDFAVFVDAAIKVCQSA